LPHAYPAHLGLDLIGIMGDALLKPFGFHGIPRYRSPRAGARGDVFSRFRNKSGSMALKGPFFHHFFHGSSIIYRTASSSLLLFFQKMRPASVAVHLICHGSNDNSIATGSL